MSVGNKFVYQHRVRYQETDQMGVVYHVNYLNWFEVARTEWIRWLGVSYARLEEKGLLFPVTEVQVKYAIPARYDELIEVHLRLVECSHLRVTFDYEVFRESDKQLLLTGFTKHVWVNRSWKPVRLQREMPELYQLIISNLSG